MNRYIACGVAILATVGVAGSAEAGVVAPGSYELNNHPDGNAGLPSYGLRLDDIIDLTPDREIFTFDFDADGANVVLDFDGTSIHIHGTAFGGLDIGNEYDAVYSGWVDIDFTYQVVGNVPGDDDLQVTTPNYSNTGTITLWDNTVVPLWDYAGNHGYTFQLGNEEDDAGHRGFDGISGWGWLNHTTMTDHVAASDWLFTVGDPVPAPGALALLGLAGLQRRRRRH